LVVRVRAKEVIRKKSSLHFCTVDGTPRMGKRFAKLAALPFQFRLRQTSH
jgi:hypothetical protein